MIKKRYKLCVFMVFLFVLNSGLFPVLNYNVINPVYADITKTIIVTIDASKTITDTRSITTSSSWKWNGTSWDNLSYTPGGTLPDNIQYNSDGYIGTLSKVGNPVFTGDPIEYVPTCYGKGSYVGEVKNVSTTATQSYSGVVTKNNQQSCTKKVDIKDLKNIISVTVDTGNVSYSVVGTEVTLNVLNGSPKSSTWDPKKYSKSVTNYLTGSSSSFPDTNTYSDSDGYYANNLVKSGGAQLISGSPGDSKTVTQSWSTTASSSWKWSGNSWTKLSYTAGSTPPSSIQYNNSGYTGTLYKSGSPVLSGDPIQNIPMGPAGSGSYVGEVRSLSTTATVPYSGTVTKSDTRVWRQKYYGTAYKGGYDYWYSYNITIKYALNSQPNISETTPAEGSVYVLPNQILAPSITVSDIDNDRLTCKYYLDNTEQEAQYITDSISVKKVQFGNINLTSLSVGKHIIKFTVNDTYTTVEKSVNFEVKNNNKPSITQVSPLNGDIYSEKSTSIKPYMIVSDLDNDKVKCSYFIDTETNVKESVDVTNTISSQKVDFSIALDFNSLSEGDHTIDFIVSDGYSSEKKVSLIKIDKSPPNIDLVKIYPNADSLVALVSASDNISGLSDRAFRFSIGNNDSGWTNTALYSLTQLNPNTQYSVTCQFKDKLDHISTKTVKVYTAASLPSIQAPEQDITSRSSRLLINDNNPNNTYYQIKCTSQEEIYYVDSSGELNKDPVWILLPNKNLVVNGLKPGTEYTFVAVAKNGDEVATENSNAITVKTKGSSTNPNVNDNPNKFDSVIDGDYEYYSNKTDEGKLYKKKLDGTSNVKLCEHNAAFVRVLGDYVYYSNWSGDKQIYKVSKNNEQLHAEPVKVNDDASWYLNVVSPNLIYYSNWLDKGKIYKFDLTTGQKQNLNGNESAWILVSGNLVFYSNGNDKGKLYALDMASRQEIKLNDDNSSHIYSKDGWIYYTNYSDSNRLYKVRPDGTGRQQTSSN